MHAKLGGWKWPIVAGIVVGILAALGSAYFIVVLPGQGAAAAAELVSIAFVAGTIAAIAARFAVALACRMRSHC